MSIELEPDSFYHIYNRANGNEKLFASKENYRFFLKRYKDLITPIADSFAYCLLPNHFHFLVRIKTIITSKPTILKREEVISYFDDLKNFIYCHKHPPELTGIE